MTPDVFIRLSRTVMTVGVLAIALAGAGLLALVLTTGVPQAWWPHTGHAFATDTSSRSSNPCGLVVGAAAEPCARHAPTGTADAVAEARRGLPVTELGLAMPFGALAVMVLWQARHTAGRGRAE